MSQRAKSLQWLLVTPWTVPTRLLCPWDLEYQSRLPFPPPRDLPNPGIKPASPLSPTLAGEFFTTELPGKPELPGSTSQNAGTDWAPDGFWWQESQPKLIFLCFPLPCSADNRIIHRLKACGDSASGNFPDTVLSIALVTLCLSVTFW